MREGSIPFNFSPRPDAHKNLKRTESNRYCVYVIKIFANRLIPIHFLDVTKSEPSQLPRSFGGVYLAAGEDLLQILDNKVNSQAPFLEFGFISPVLNTLFAQTQEKNSAEEGGE